ncbi:TVP38/TMEM64 family protein [Paenibacillus crassostreae]|uniref:TVP38/TMEM64 family membrane protein n=1 Tax=Paenibacillus crassostreae TaxID=1763538 RepID=A0A167DGG5_9BACL|nr:VTT domain-containing protein [Paenibacillus crassostreae]AOZ91502.1 TVP38/TMEM64 family protein [Paenibacillus crassostreae]OAB74339.1 hypothetical protein PNBC_09690 [Paenibacillus crassostreae]
MKKLLLPLLYVLVLGVAFIYKSAIWEYLNSVHSLTLLILIATLLALFPILPYKIVIAALGYAYGTVSATLIAWIGTTLAAVIIYAIVRYAFREQGRRYLSRRRSIHSFTTLTETHPFIAIIVARLLPILPQMVVNIFAGVASISLWTYTLASGLGKIPAILLYAYLGGNVMDHPLISLIALLGYLLLIGIVLLIYRRVTQKRLN